jgi:hypothetical protein
MMQAAHPGCAAKFTCLDENLALSIFFSQWSFFMGVLEPAHRQATDGPEFYRIVLIDQIINNLGDSLPLLIISYQWDGFCSSTSIIVCLLRGEHYMGLSS